jgi:hypothetical protein
MENQRYPSELYAVIRHLRYNYTDDIPNRIVSNEGTFKVRRAWFNSLSLRFQQASEEGYVSERTREAYDALRALCFGKDHITKRLTKPEDISAGNRVLDLLIEDMEKIQRESESK